MEQVWGEKEVRGVDSSETMWPRSIVIASLAAAWSRSHGDGRLIYMFARLYDVFPGRFSGGGILRRWYMRARLNGVGERTSFKAKALGFIKAHDNLSPLSL